LNKGIFAALPLLAVVFAGCNNSGGGGKPVAIVNNDPINEMDYFKYLERKRTVLAVTPQGPVDVQVAGSLGLQALRDLVNRRLLIQIAKDQSVSPTEEEIKRELDFQTKRNPQFVKALQSAGMSLTEIRADLSIDLARFKLLTKGITVTPADVDKYIKDNPTEFVSPAQVDLYYIQVSSDQGKKQVDAALKQGTSFPVAASRFSEAPNARTNQGQFPLRVLDQMPDPLQAIIKKAKVGTATDWVPDGGNFLKFFVANRTNEEKIKIDETIRESVRRRIAEERGSQANDLGKSIQEKMRSAKIDVKAEHLAQGWKEAMDQLKAEQASNSAGTGAPTP
jgi:parvulin-like peptidyl-prolyl isomerase